MRLPRLWRMDNPQTYPPADLADVPAGNSDPAAPVLNPRRQFRSPEMLVCDESMSDAEKYALLREWDLEIDNRLKAEEEGMSASDPISSHREAKLADEAARVKSCLMQMALRLGHD